MSQYRCGNCGEMYTSGEYMDLDMVPVDEDNPEQYGNETVCGECGARMHSEKWQKRETATSPDGIEVDVSTTALLIPHGLNHNQWFETCLFYDRGSSVVERYETQDEAEKGHEKYIEKIELGSFHFESVSERIVMD